MINTKISGHLCGVVTLHKTTIGGVFATWRMAAVDRHGVSQVCDCLSDSKTDIEALQALSDGDPVVVCGFASVGVLAGAHEGQSHGLSVRVEAVRTAHHPGINPRHWTHQAMQAIDAGH
ncbi:hypothetical protein [Limnohabitans sp. DM1]|uniref:hypothetical protein n=1 Tax=Limnohabitans sp. DM1 TaxID=1597955 RepID=UPI0018929F61|nr:hypothetical protein [Limnohabitans sp. DM1]